MKRSRFVKSYFLRFSQIFLIIQWFFTIPTGFLRQAVDFADLDLIPLIKHNSTGSRPTTVRYYIYEERAGHFCQPAFAIVLLFSLFLVYFFV